MQPDLDPKMRARQEAKLEELKAALAQHQRQELERKYATRYHKVKGHALTQDCTGMLRFSGCLGALFYTAEPPDALLL